MAATVGTTVGTGTDFAAPSRYVKAEGLLQRRKTYYAVRAAALALALGGVVAGVCLLGTPGTNSYWPARAARY